MIRGPSRLLDMLVNAKCRVSSLLHSDDEKLMTSNENDEDDVDIVAYNQPNDEVNCTIMEDMRTLELGAPCKGMVNCQIKFG